MRLKSIFVPALATLCSITVMTTSMAASAKKVKPQIIVRADKQNAIYKVGEKIVFSISVKKGDEVIVGQTLNYTLKGNGESPQSGSIVSAENPVTIETKLGHPGFVLCTVDYKGEGKKKVVGRGGAGVEPLKITAAKEAPKDFNLFWTNKLAPLKKFPMNPVLTPASVRDIFQERIEIYDLKLDCPGGAPVSGYYSKPKNAKPKSHPAYVSFHGAGVRSSNKLYNQPLKGMIALDINAHGIDNGKPSEFYKELKNGKLRGYKHFNKNDKDKIYFSGMFQRVHRALQFIKAQPEWDGKTLIVFGSSQGGAQALVAAGLDKDVSLCIARVSAMCDHFSQLKKRNNAWPQFIRATKDKTFDKQVEETVPYYDSVNFAKNIQCPVIMTVGFIDTVSTPSSVYAAYNNITSKKEMINNIEAGHVNPRDVTTELNKRIYAHAKAAK